VFHLVSFCTQYSNALVRKVCFI